MCPDIGLLTASLGTSLQCFVQSNRGQSYSPPVMRKVRCRWTPVINSNGGRARQHELFLDTLVPSPLSPHQPHFSPLSNSICLPEVSPMPCGLLPARWPQRRLLAALSCLRCASRPAPLPPSLVLPCLPSPVASRPSTSLDTRRTSSVSFSPNQLVSRNCC